MAMSNCLIGKPSSTVATLAVRPIAFPRILCSASVKMQTSCNAHNLCTDAKKNLQLHQKLVTSLKTQMTIIAAAGLEEDIPPVPVDFPFTIKKFNYGSRRLELTRELDGERIDVDVSIPCELRNSSNIYDDKLLKEPTADIAPSVFLTMEISRENGKGLKFEVYLSSDDIRVIYLLVVEPAPGSDSPHRYGYYDLKDGSDLQIALGEFVEMRGIEKKHAEFLFNYIVESYKRRPVVVLEKLENYFNE